MITMAFEAHSNGQKRKKGVWRAQWKGKKGPKTKQWWDNTPEKEDDPEQDE